MENRLRLCRIASYIGIGMVLVVYIAMTWVSGGEERIAALPAWAPTALQLLLGLGSALTIGGIMLGLYYKGRARRRGPKK